MPWKLGTTEIHPGNSWTDSSGVKHPTNWMRWTDEYKNTVGLVWHEPLEEHDDRFYTGREADGTLIPREVSNLIERALTQSASKAYSLLGATDWYVVRLAETSTAIPQSVKDYRSSVRTASDAIKLSINSVTTFLDFTALYIVPVDIEGVPTGNAPINDWPIEE